MSTSTPTPTPTPNDVSLLSYLTQNREISMQLFFEKFKSLRQVFYGHMGNYNACQIQQSDYCVRLGPNGGRLISNILALMRSAHEQNFVLGDLIHPSKIWFHAGNLLYPYLEKIETAHTPLSLEGRIKDYKNLKSVIDSILQYSGVLPYYFPLELKDLFEALNNPIDREDYIQNHWSLWDYERRYKIVLDYYASGGNRLVEEAILSYSGTLGLNIEVDVYIPDVGFIRDVWANEYNTSIGDMRQLIAFMRHCYAHPRGNSKYFIEQELHKSFPNAITWLCKALDDYNVLEEYWN